MTYRVAVDIGGTFTDCVVVDGGGRRSVSKALTTHENLIDGVFAALRTNAQQLGFELPALLDKTVSFVHGTTVATNAVLTRSGAKTALITTLGHEDTLPIGKVQSHIAGLSGREIVHLSRLDKPIPLVPRDLIRGVVERIDRAGDVIVPLDERGARTVVGELVRSGIEAIAVCFLWSFLNSRHERQMREIITEAAPGVSVACSYEIAPILGEYERAVATVLNVYVGPQVTSYLEQLEQRLRGQGLGVPLLVMQSNGGVTSAPEACAIPLVTLDSGPTGGILGCRHVASAYGEDNVVCTDVGGTSFDVGLILGGAARVDSEPVVSQHRFRLSKVSVRSIGAGGGSIAWVDEGGLLRVGPSSAGSRPGPACYGHGGQAATVTDADVALGYLDAEYFSDGRIRLDRDRAMTALHSLGAKLSMEPEEVALGIFRITNAQMADLIRRSTIEQGYDPRDCLLVAYGGAATTHAAFYGSDIGAKRILIPSGSSVFSAEGMLTCDIVHAAEASKVARSPFDDGAIVAVEDEWQRLEARVLAQFDREGIDADAVETEWIARVRYYRQAHTLEIPVKQGNGPMSLKDLHAQFEQRQRAVYGGRALVPDAQIELVLVRVVGRRRIEAPIFEGAHSPSDSMQRGEARKRRVYFEPDGFIEVAVTQEGALQPGATVRGPAVIDRSGDTVVVPPGMRAAIDSLGALTLTGERQPDGVQIPNLPDH